MTVKLSHWYGRLGNNILQINYKMSLRSLKQVDTDIENITVILKQLKGYEKQLIAIAS